MTFPFHSIESEWRHRMDVDYKIDFNYNTFLEGSFFLFLRSKQKQKESIVRRRKKNA